MPKYSGSIRVSFRAAQTAVGAVLEPFQRPLEKKSIREVLGAKRPALIKFKCSYVCNLIKEGEIINGLRLKKIKNVFSMFGPVDYAQLTCMI